jgi:hypothetical protein
MKRKLSIIAIALTALLSTGCLNEISVQFDNLERRVSSLEERCKKINDNISSLQSIVDKLNTYDFVEKVTTLYEGSAISGYTIYFTHSDPITIFNGKDAETPLIGVKADTDGNFYWTVSYANGKMEYLYNNFGQKMPATAVVPQIKIVDGNWAVSYDEGEIWQTLGQATGNSGTSFIKSVEDSTSFIRFRFMDGTVVDFPTWEAFQKLQKAVSTVNKNLESFAELVARLDSYTCASGITPILNGQDTIGYRIYLSDGTSMPFYNGVVTNMPEISAKRDASNPKDTSYYWTIKFDDDKESEWILCDGKKVKAEASVSITPQVGLKKWADNLYYWTISYDGGVKFDWMMKNGNKVQASCDPVNDIITNVALMGSNTIGLVINRETVFIPMYVKIVVDMPQSITMKESDIFAFDYTIPSGTATTDILVVSNDGFYVEVTKTNNQKGKITVSSPASFISGSTSHLTVYVSDGLGALTIYKITIKYGTRS